MSFVRFIVICLTSLVSLRAQTPPVTVLIEGTPASHTLTWNSHLGYNYRVERSNTLGSWTDLGIEKAGNNGMLAHGFSTPSSARTSYRIRQTRDPNNAGFLTRPLPEEDFDLTDGVCFAFDLSWLPKTPAYISISKRPEGGSWQLIGKITDFATIDGIRFVRGSAVWVADTAGVYEVQATAKDSDGITILGTTIRRITIGANTPPVITITEGPLHLSPTPQSLIFTIEVSDADGDAIKRVEFFDNGQFIGADSAAPFGDEFKGIDGVSVLVPQSLLKGTHSITAKAFDERGGIGETIPYLVNITGGNTRPVLEIVSPDDGTEVFQGGTLVVDYNASDDDGNETISNVFLIDGNSLVDTDPYMTFGYLQPTTTSGWRLGTHVLAVTARDESGAESYPQFVKIFINGVGDNITASDLAERIAHADSAAPSNANFSGQLAACGLFEDGLASGLEMGRGALLTTGEFAYWDDGDSSNAKGRSWNAPGNSELEIRVAGQRTLDASVLEFDCFCSNTQLECLLQFGSEEYTEYTVDAGTIGCYNDAFIVTVDGVLVSLTPDCEDIMSVNSIHPLLVAAESACNLPSDVDPRRGHLFLDNEDDIVPNVLPENLPRRVEYDGMTIRLRLHAFVTPNQTHHIRIIVADVNDPSLDTAVFIEEGSILTRDPSQ